MESEQLGKRAAKVGEHFLRELEDLRARPPARGWIDARGRFIGLEFAGDREAKEPAGEEAIWMPNFCVREGFALGEGRLPLQPGPPPLPGVVKVGLEVAQPLAIGHVGLGTAERWRVPTMPRMERTTHVRVTVTRVAGDGSVRRAVVDAAGRDDAARWEQLIEQAGLGVPPPYRPRPGEAVYHIRAGELEVQVAERDLTGPLRELVTAVLAEGGDS
jgi:hypothetical protein